MKWDGDADQQLLLAILATHPITINHDAVAARIGPDCTPRAVIERLKKLKKMAKDRGFEDDAGTPRVPKTPTKATATKGGTTSPSKKKTAGVKKVKAGVKQEAPEVADEEHGLSPEVYSDQLPKIMEPINGHSTNGHISSLSQTNGSTLKRSRDDFEDEIDDPLALVESKRIKEELGPVLDEPSHFSNGTYGLDGLIGTDLDAPLGVFDVDEPTYFYDAVEDGGLGTSGWTHPL